MLSLQGNSNIKLWHGLCGGCMGGGHGEILVVLDKEVYLPSYYMICGRDWRAY